MFEGVDSADKDPRESIHIQEVATPELAPDEAYVAVMASAINFNSGLLDLQPAGDTTTSGVDAWAPGTCRASSASRAISASVSARSPGARSRSPVFGR